MAAECLLEESQKSKKRKGMYRCIAGCMVCTGVSRAVWYVQVYHGLYGMYRCIAGCMVCTGVSRAAWYVQVYHGLYGMYRCITGCMVCTGVSRAVWCVQVYHGLYGMYRCITGCIEVHSVNNNITLLWKTAKFSRTQNQNPQLTETAWNLWKICPNQIL